VPVIVHAGADDAALAVPDRPARRRNRWGGHLVLAYDPVVGSSLIIRPARVQDVAQMARVHVRCWQETYRGLMPDAVLDDPGFPAARERDDPVRGRGTGDPHGPWRLLALLSEQVLELIAGCAAAAVTGALRR
jgi:hypothetical protein